ncbi:hypothetical protein ZWY2020_010399 [Hordeum vulgare]|nr:hypothetical protein ZWY2020_010399 [Hordeum vulgare]
MALYTISNSINKLNGHGWQYQRFSAIFPIFPRIGIDSIGGVRVPGGYCRLLAFRLSHVVISNSGVTRIAPSLDTIDTSTYILKRSRMTRKQLMYQDVQASSDSCQHT